MQLLSIVVNMNGAMKSWTDIVVIIFNKAWKWCSLYIMTRHKQFSNMNKKKESFSFIAIQLNGCNVFSCYAHSTALRVCMFYATKWLRDEKLCETTKKCFSVSRATYQIWNSVCIFYLVAIFPFIIIIENIFVLLSSEVWH